MKLQKETISNDESRSANRHGKWYEDACGTAFALELVGERWSLLIVRELMFGGRRFSDLRSGLPGISAKVLTERLESLEAAGIVRRRQLPPPVSAQVYELTEWGYGAETAIKELGRWAATSPDHDPTLPLSPASLMLSFRTMFDGERAGGLKAKGAVRIGKERFFVKVAKGRLKAERGELDNPDFTIAAPVASLIAGMVYGKAAPADLPGVEVSGDARKLAAYVDCFHLPAKAG
ncbi:MAG: helix-turn-helix domain-containing protein [Novosphingobium sp.]